MVENIIEYYEERAAILEFDAEMTRKDAEWNAIMETMDKFNLPIDEVLLLVQKSVNCEKQ